jgi:predicted phage terminase large subunit-like protein
VLGNTRWFVGTFYHMASTYHTLIKRGAVKARLYAATKDGTFDGEPWFWSKQLLAQKIQDMGTYVASCQLFNNPLMEGEQTFAPDWLQYWRPERYHGMNIYIVVDPANSKTKKSDYTVMWVIGLGPDKNYYIIDGLRDKLTIKERTQRLMALHSQYRPSMVGYEKYGIQTDIEFIQEIQDKENYRFQITPLGGNMSKVDRIKRLQPLFESKRVYMPEKLIRVDYQGRNYDLVQEFVNQEYLQFPYMTHDDMLDCMARITDGDLKAFFPSPAVVDRHGRPVDSDKDSTYDYDTYAYIKA